jgi:hypothetical protein
LVRSPLSDPVSPQLNGEAELRQKLNKKEEARNLWYRALVNHWEEEKRETHTMCSRAGWLQMACDQETSGRREYFSFSLTTVQCSSRM